MDEFANCRIRCHLISDINLHECRHPRLRNGGPVAPALLMAVRAPVVKLISSRRAEV